MNFAVKAVKAADKLLSMFIAIAVILSMLFAGTALYDTLAIYQSAATDSHLLKYKPQNVENGSDLSLSELQQLNKDVSGWLVIDDTKIDYPVVQGKSNTEYLNKNIYGEFALSGSIFLDYRNAKEYTDFYSLLYGHHMEGGAMFGDLVNFTDTDYFEQHPTGTLYLSDKTYQIELFACVAVDAYDEIAFEPGANETNQAKLLLDYIQEQAVQYREISFLEEGRIIGLSTCSDASTNGRILVYGQLIPLLTNPQEGGVN